MIRWALFVSGEGSNLQNVLDLEKSDLKNQEVSLVLANRDCRGIERAKTSHKKAFVFEGKIFEQEALRECREMQITHIFLLGFMKVLSPLFLATWKGEILNLHPSILPAHRGLDAIRKAYEAHDPYLGITIHRVVAEVDSGAILFQATIPRQSDWTLEEATKQVHALEYESVRHFLLNLEKPETL